MSPNETSAIDSLAAGSLMTTVGARIRERRKARKLTLPQLAEAARLSVGLVSQIERGKGNPNLATLVALGEALDLPLVQLIAPESRDSPVLRVSDRRSIDTRDAGGALHTAQLLSRRADTALETILIETEPGATTGPDPITHYGEEIGIVLEGTREVHLDNEVFVLEAGDTISYDSTRPHWHRNPGPGKERSIWIVTPPRGQVLHTSSHTP